MTRWVFAACLACIASSADAEPASEAEAQKVVVAWHKAAVRGDVAAIVPMLARSAKFHLWTPADGDREWTVTTGAKELAPVVKAMRKPLGTYKGEWFVTTEGESRVAFMFGPILQKRFCQELAVRVSNELRILDVSVSERECAR